MLGEDINRTLCTSLRDGHGRGGLTNLKQEGNRREMQGTEKEKGEHKRESNTQEIMEKVEERDGKINKYKDGQSKPEKRAHHETHCKYSYIHRFALIFSHNNLF